MEAAYFNENDAFAAAWLRNLWPAAHVDERSITDVDAAALAWFRRCHFFGGIGGWEYALGLAGWPREWPVWTGSCPCQPFSDAGQQKAEADSRHLWPEFLRLISERRPPAIFGEQVASRLGREWLAGVRVDLEALGYAVGAADLCAAGIGAPHRRQRLYWVANSQGERRRVGESTDIGAAYREGHTLADTDAARLEGLGDSASTRPQRQWREYLPGGERCSGLAGLAMQAGVPQWNGPTIAVECSDGSRRISAQPDAFPLAHGVSRRMGQLRGAGNAIVPQLAAVFVKAAMPLLHFPASG